MPLPIEPRPWNARKTVIAGSVLVAFFIYTYFIRDVPGPANPVFRGRTMGTTYEVKVAEADLSSKKLDALSRSIDRTLIDLNQQVSTWIPESDISRFNRTASATGMPIRAEFATIARASIRLAEETGGAFDPTLGPVINLWGFGSGSVSDAPPEPSVLDEAMAQTGIRHLEVGDGILVKAVPGLQLNFGAIAKGYGVDRVSELLAEQGLTNTYVEIGGEVRVRGHNLEGGPWRIGIDLPVDHAPMGEQVAVILALSDHAIATSGDYRNFVEEADGSRRSHLLDPRTGRPVDHDLASVSVVAPDCMSADGIATALAVMGPEAALEWVNHRPDTEAILLVRTAKGTFERLTSDGFEALVYRPEP